MPLTILLLHAAATWAMVGLIWFVQVVHYPLFAHVGAGGYPEYQRRHQRLTTFVVGPLMLIELSCAAWLVMHPSVFDPALAWAGLGLLAAIWLSTGLVQVPCHTRLARGFEASTHRRLCASNWFRTIAWSARGVIALLLLAR